MDFMFSWQEQYLTRSLRSLVRYCSCHSNIKSISSRNRVISSIYLNCDIGLKGGPPTDLKNMAGCQEWKGQRFKKIYVRKITQHEEKFS